MSDTYELQEPLGLSDKMGMVEQGVHYNVEAKEDTCSCRGLQCSLPCISRDLDVAPKLVDRFVTGFLD